MKTLSVFSLERGYYKATTAMVAKAAGVTQPYVFHFFENKEELFKAVIDRAFSRIHNTFSQVEAPADQLIETMGHGFNQIIQTHRDEVLMVMQAYAISEVGIREHVRKLFLTIFESLTLKMERSEFLMQKRQQLNLLAQVSSLRLQKYCLLPELICGEDRMK